MEKIFKLGETDPEVMNYPELIDIIYDVIYADIKLIEEYEYNELLPGISIPMVMVTGNRDIEAPLDDMKEWAKYTSDHFYIKEFDGDHFFPFNCQKFEEYFLSMIDKTNKSLL